jgi:hypothetical protein
VKEIRKNRPQSHSRVTGRFSQSKQDEDDDMLSDRDCFCGTRDCRRGAGSADNPGLDSAAAVDAQLARTTDC